MSTPIHFMGKDYARVEDMPPDIRSIYEMTAGKDKVEEVSEVMQMFLNIKAGADADTSRPWDSPTGSGEIAVPAGFETVMGLGPADHLFVVQRTHVSSYMIVLVMGLGMAVAFFVLGVLGPQEAAAGMIIGLALPGLFMIALALWNMWSLSTGVQALVTYRDGFAFRKGRIISTWAWTEIASIVSKEVYRHKSRGPSWTDRTYILSKQNGETVTLTGYQLEKIIDLRDIIKRRAFAVMLPPYQQAYQSGQPVTFGPVTVSQANGLQADGKQFAWSDIVNVEVKNGKLEISTKDAGLLSGVHNVRASHIPNIEILCQLIGIDPWMIDLSYI